MGLREFWGFRDPLDPPIFLPQIRYRKDKGAPPAPPPFPPVRGLQDLASGGVLAAAIHFYCPQFLRLEGKDVVLGGIFGGFF